MQGWYAFVLCGQGICVVFNVLEGFKWIIFCVCIEYALIDRWKIFVKNKWRKKRSCENELMNDEIENYRNSY